MIFREEGEEIPETPEDFQSVSTYPVTFIGGPFDGKTNQYPLDMIQQAPKFAIPVRDGTSRKIYTYTIELVNESWCAIYDGEQLPEQS